MNKIDVVIFQHKDDFAELMMHSSWRPASGINACVIHVEDELRFDCCKTIEKIESFFDLSKGDILITARVPKNMVEHVVDECVSLEELKYEWIECAVEYTGESYHELIG